MELYSVYLSSRREELVSVRRAPPAAGPQENLWVSELRHFFPGGVRTPPEEALQSAIFAPDRPLTR